MISHAFRRVISITRLKRRAAPLFLPRNGGVMGGYTTLFFMLF